MAKRRLLQFRLASVVITIFMIGVVAAYYRDPGDTWLVWQFPLYLTVSFYVVYCRSSCNTKKSATLAGTLVSIPAVFFNAAILGFAGEVPVWDERPHGFYGALIVPLEVLIITLLGPLLLVFWPLVLAMGAVGGLAGLRVRRWVNGDSAVSASPSHPLDA